MSKNIATFRTRIDKVRQQLKKTPHLKEGVIVVVAGLLGTLPSLSATLTHGHDYLFHFYRLRSTTNAFLDGQVIPQVDPNMLGGMGYSWNMFYGPLSTYIASLFHLATQSWPVAINSFIVTSVILSGATMYAFTYRVSQTKLLSVFAAIIYMLAPYHILDIYVRHTHGELLVFAFIPLLFHGLYNILHKKPGVILAAIATAGIILSHNISIIVMATVAALFLLLNIKKILNTAAALKLATVGIMALALSAFYVLPLIELKNTDAYRIFSEPYGIEDMATHAFNMNYHAVNFVRFILPGSPDNDVKARHMDISFGLPILIAIGLFWFYRKKIPAKNRQIVYQFLAIGLFFTFISTSFINWYNMPSYLYTLQFPWRFLMPVAFLLSFSAAFILYYALNTFTSHRQNYGLAVIAITTIAMISAAPFLNQALHKARTWDNKFYYNITYPRMHLLSIYQYAPTSLLSPSERSTGRPSDSTQKSLIKRGSDLVILNDSITASIDKKEGTHVTLSATSQSAGSVELPLIYYPGYKYSIDKNTQYTSMSKDGYVKIDIPANFDGSIDVWFGLSRYSLIGLIISLATSVGVCTFALLKRHKKMLKK